MPSEKIRCELCVFWKDTQGQDWDGYEGQCRRFPPEVVPGGRQWPSTDSHDWCGEFQYPEEWLDEDLEDDLDDGLDE